MSRLSLFQNGHVSPKTEVTADNDANLPQTVNPRDTDRRFQETRYDALDISISYGTVTPETSTSACASRRQSVALSQASPTYFPMPSPASVEAFPGFHTPQSSNSSLSSRRESIVVPGPQFQGNEMSSSPSPSRQNSWVAPPGENYSITATPCTAAGDLPTSSVFVDLQQFIPDNELSMAFSNSQLMDWQFILADQGTGVDPRESSSAPMAVRNMALTAIESPAECAFDFGDIASSGVTPSQATALSKEPVIALGPAFEYPMGSDLCSPGSSALSDDDSLAGNLSSRRKVPQTLAKRRGKRRTIKREEIYPDVPIQTVNSAHDNLHVCEICPKVWSQSAQRWIEGRSFKRPEHLKRHEENLHKGSSTMYHNCPIANCHRPIKARMDNLNAHLAKTHFKYGKTEQSGINQRLDLRVTREMNFLKSDPRWKELLEGRMQFGDSDTPAEERGWKMLGYSIKETESMRIKDIVSDWDGPDDLTLKHVDPRWKKLLAGDMTFEQAMDRGHTMLETEAEGVLGVDMLTTEEMGLKHLDPRWKKLLNGNMSVEMSERLGVKPLNPQWLIHTK